MQLMVAENVTALQDTLAGIAGQGRRIALVPTMGALHSGHMALVEAAKQQADFVVVSIFVNPAQFGPNEDFDHYPRALEQDLAMLREAGVALAYTPSVEDMYPKGFTTSVSVGDIGRILCGKSRPGHFDGVATVVAKLLLRVLPHVALFGEKDYQQLCVIRRMGYDLDIPIDIVGVPTVREADGLAMSSRNRYLSPQERALAPQFHAMLLDVAKQVAATGDINAALMVAGMKLGSAGFKVDYVDVCAEHTLHRLDKLVAPARVLGAVWLGNTRLIDNVTIG
jgi:pantoate--beta-alanine ligase